MLPKANKKNASLPILWCYPNTYAIGMAGLGYQLVWRILEQDNDTVVKRGFTDVEENNADTSELLGFTLSWELDFINILKILSRHKVTEIACERADEEPLVFGGGPVLSANPEPFACFFDVVLLGDAEVVVPEFLKAYKSLCQIKNRKEKLLALAQVPGVYVPQFYQYEIEDKTGPIRSIRSKDFSLPNQLHKQVFSPPEDYVAHSAILSPDTTWGDMFLVEVVRSCPQECRFCLASFLTRPFRSTKVHTLMQAIDLGLRYTNKIGLLGPSVTEHPQFSQIAELLLERPNTQISLASVRADTLTEPILSMLKRLGQRSVTIAIESGSERLRSIMKKNLTEEEIVRAVDLIAQSGLKGVKFYGIAGLPYETMDDLDETVRLMAQLKRSHRKLKIVFGLSSFVPKAQTPFQWFGRDRLCKRKMGYLVKHLAKLGIEVRAESHNWSDIQALLSRGDRRLTSVLQQVSRTGNHLGAWKQSLRDPQSSCPTFDFYVYRNIPAQETLPWSHLVDGSKTDYLNQHYETAGNLALTKTQ